MLLRQRLRSASARAGPARGGVAGAEAATRHRGRHRPADPSRHRPLAGRGARDTRDMRDMRDMRDTRDARDARDACHTRDARDACDTRDTHDMHGTRGMRGTRGTRDMRDARDTLDTIGTRDTHDTRVGPCLCAHVLLCNSPEIGLFDTGRFSSLGCQFAPKYQLCCPVGVHK